VLFRVVYVPGYNGIVVEFQHGRQIAEDVQVSESKKNDPVTRSKKSEPEKKFTVKSNKRVLDVLDR
jgi:hypothetical protein